MGLLERCNGPECPRCGCQDAKILQAPAPGAKSWWADSGRARCQHCGIVFSFREIAPVETESGRPRAESGEPNAEKGTEPIPDSRSPIPDPPDPDRGIVYHVIRCPICNSDQVRITRVARPVRYHKCKACQHNFKSVEGH